MSIKITCIRRHDGSHENPYTAITHLGWVNESTGKCGKFTRLQIYQLIKDGGEAYVKDKYGKKNELIIAETCNGTRYVKTEAEDIKSDHILHLPEF